MRRDDGCDDGRRDNGRLDHRWRDVGASELRRRRTRIRGHQLVRLERLLHARLDRARHHVARAQLLAGRDRCRAHAGRDLDAAVRDRHARRRRAHLDREQRADDRHAHARRDDLESAPRAAREVGEQRAALEPHRRDRAGRADDAQLCGPDE